MKAGDLAELIEVEALHDARFRLAYDYWNAQRGDRIAPPRREIDPLDLKPVLACIAVLDVLREPLDFRYRLAGTAICDMHGKEMRGKLVSEHEPPDFARTLWLLLRRVVETGKPQATRWRLREGLGFEREFEVLRLPLSDDGERVDHILIVSGFGYQPERLRDYLDALQAAAPAAAINPPVRIRSRC